MLARYVWLCDAVLDVLCYAGRLVQSLSYDWKLFGRRTRSLFGSQQGKLHTSGACRSVARALYTGYTYVRWGYLGGVWSWVAG